MTNPLVSIIVPVYNAQKGLSRCLESICSQTYQELEIIVLNDGSTDDSLAICEQFRAKDPRLVVVDKENEGVSRTRNAGLALAQGDYIQFADSDDVLDPDYTQNLVQAALQHSADLVIAPYWMVIPSNSSKTGHALVTLQESLGIEPEAPKTEVHKYGFLPQGVYSREDYARRLMLVAYAGAWVMNLSAFFFLNGIALSWFHLSAESAAMAMQVMRWFNVISLFIWPASFTLPNILRAAGDATFTMTVSVFSMWVFRVAFCYLMVLGFHQAHLLSIWGGMFLDWVFRSLFFAIRFSKGSWLEKKVI